MTGAGHFEEANGDREFHKQPESRQSAGEQKLSVTAELCHCTRSGKRDLLLSKLHYLSVLRKRRKAIQTSLPRGLFYTLQFGF